MELTELTLEQQFNIRAYADTVKTMPLSVAQESLVILYREMLVRENMYKQFIKDSWGLEAAKGEVK